MAYLVDTNLLLRSAEVGHPMHSPAVDAIRLLLAQGEVIYTTAQNLYEFWVVATRPIERNGLGLGIASAEAELVRLESQFPLLSDTRDGYDEWRRLVTTHSVMGVNAHDTRLVASMLVHGVSHILTFNVADFQRYPGITVVHPQMVR
ncbi:MAG: type II toxin-antitoxin system VapC family toxin [Actinomycetota bacterium]